MLALYDRESRRVLPTLGGILGCAVLALASPAIAEPTLAGCQVFPGDNIWNVPVDDLPVDPSSGMWVTTIGAGKGMHADFGSGFYPEVSDDPIGIPWVGVPSSQPFVAIVFDDEAATESDPGPYPIPPDAPIEGGATPEPGSDQHVLVVRQDACFLFELYSAIPQLDGSWDAYSGAVFDLSSNDLRTEGDTSADAAGLPILPGLVRYEEVDSGEIRHALRFTVPDTRRAYVWPGRHYASSLTGSQYPPMGQRFRLKASFDTSGFPADVQVILQALKRYGMMLADNGSAWYLSGVPSESWDNDELQQLGNVHGSDFEAVDATLLKVYDNSGETTYGLFRDGFESGDTSAW